MKLAHLLLGLALVGGSASADPLLLYNGRLFVQATIGSVRTEALLDSGAEATLLSPQLAQRAGLPSGTAQTIRGSGGTATARLVEGARIHALGVDLHPDAVVVTDLSELSRRLIKRPTDMVLGRELFDAAPLRIDIEHRRVDVLSRSVRAEGSRIALTGHLGVESIPITVDGRLVNADLDLGNGSLPLVSRALATKLHLQSVGKTSGGGIGGPRVRDIVLVPRVELGGLVFHDVRAAVDDLSNANDFNVGTSILKNFVVTTDFKGRAVWLKPLRKGVNGRL